MLSRDQVSIVGEIDYIIGKAQECDCRVVRLGNLILFSTQTGDAWLLDPDDGLALCLSRDGERQDYSALETATSFQIGWNAQYRVEDEVFVVVTQDGRMRSILGYPTRKIRSGMSGIPERQ